jgi:hypothetical protein
MHLTRHIFVKQQSTIGHHELRLVRLADYTPLLPLTIFRRDRTMISAVITPPPHFSTLS